MCDKAAGKKELPWDNVLTRFMIQEVCDKVIFAESGLLSFVPESFTTQEIGEYITDKLPCTLPSAPNFYKTQKKCENVVIKESFTTEYILIAIRLKKIVKNTLKKCVKSWF